MTDKATITIASSGQAQINGPMTLDTVAALYHQAQDGPAFSSVDLCGVSHVDSSGLALLLEWQSRARKQQQHLHIENPPDDLVSLARLSEATELLSMVARSGQQAASATATPAMPHANADVAPPHTNTH